MNTLISYPQVRQRHSGTSRCAETRAFQQKLKRATRLEALFYRYHRLLGASVIAGAVYALWFWIEAHDRTPVLSLAGLEPVTVLIHLLVLMLGVVIFAYPGLIKDVLIQSVEPRANNWHLQGPEFGPMLAREYRAMERWLVLYPRLLGLVALCSAVYAALALYPALMSMLGAA